MYGSNYHAVEICGGVTKAGWTDGRTNDKEKIASDQEASESANIVHSIQTILHKILHTQYPPRRQYQGQLNPTEAEAAVTAHKAPDCDPETENQSNILAAVNCDPGNRK